MGENSSAKQEYVGFMLSARAVKDRLTTYEAWERECEQKLNDLLKTKNCASAEVINAGKELSKCRKELSELRGQYGFYNAMSIKAKNEYEAQLSKEEM